MREERVRRERERERETAGEEKVLPNNFCSSSVKMRAEKRVRRESAKIERERERLTFLCWWCKLRTKSMGDVKEHGRFVILKLKTMDFDGFVEG